MEINGVAHLVLRVTRFGECVDFYDQLMPELGLQAVHRREGFVYYVGGRTALGVRQADSEHADHAHVETGPGIDHLCRRARSRAEIDYLYLFLRRIGADLT
jgi:catechol 2,3-dioxygenase-like lactoylglutathione lyase family enzyme